METWRGRFPITNFVLMALSHKAQDPAGIKLSQEEQTLFDSCEFWAAMADRTLTQFLAQEPVVRLLAAQQAFSISGALRVASALRVALRDVTRGADADTMARVARELEEALVTTEDRVDELVSSYASDRLMASPAGK